jgi:hypothetical protein
MSPQAGGAAKIKQPTKGEAKSKHNSVRFCEDGLQSGERELPHPDFLRSAPPSSAQSRPIHHAQKPELSPAKRDPLRREPEDKRD